MYACVSIGMLSPQGGSVCMKLCMNVIIHPAIISIFLKKNFNPSSFDFFKRFFTVFISIVSHLMYVTHTSLNGHCNRILFDSSLNTERIIWKN